MSNLYVLYSDELINYAWKNATHNLGGGGGGKPDNCGWNWILTFFYGWREPLAIKNVMTGLKGTWASFIVSC